MIFKNALLVASTFLDMVILTYFLQTCISHIQKLNLLWDSHYMSIGQFLFCIHLHVK